MDQNINSEHCYLTPDFPKQTFCSFLFIGNKANNFSSLWPLTGVFPNLDEVSSYTKVTVEDIEKRSDVITPEFSIVMPLTFIDLFPLKKEFWQNPHQHFDELNRTTLMVKALNKPQFYKVLVTPSNFQNNRWDYLASIPFYVSQDLSVVEKFMLYSDWPVDSRAKYAAFYQMNEPHRFNWITKELGPTMHEMKFANKDIS